MTERLNFELMKELRIAGSRMMHPGKPGIGHGPMGGRPPMGGHCHGGKGFRAPGEMRPDNPMRNREVHGFESRPPMAGEAHGFERPLPREFVLSILLDAGNTGMRQKDLAEKIGNRPAAMSESINKLEDNGYIERRVDETDRRATLIFLTEKGEARACEIRDQRERRFDRMFGGLTVDQKELLLTLLRKMNAGMGQTE